MPHLPRPDHRFCAAALAAVLLGGLLLTGPASAARSRPATPVIVKPAQLPRGADIGIAHVEGSSVVDGSTRIAVAGAERLELLGRSGTSYVVAAFDTQGRQRVLRVSTKGVTTLLTPPRSADVVVLSADGTRLAQSAPNKAFTRSRVRVWDAGTGAPVASKVFEGLTSVLDLDASRVLLDVDRDFSTRSWSTASGAVRLVVKRDGYRADIAADRLASFDGDPFAGGCTVVTRLSKPNKQLWRSCNERVETFSPKARRMATVDLLTDGIGPSQVLVRGPGGASKGVYRIRGYFGRLTWESGSALLLESFGPKKSATVRCTDGTCVRASELAPTPKF